MINCIVLAAGSSKRFGSPKALAPIHSSLNIVYLLNKLVATKPGELIIVLGADSDMIEPCIFKHSKIRVVYNYDHYLGQLSSIKVGLKASAQSTQGSMILPVDCPFVTAETIDRLAKHFLTTRATILIPTFNGRKGHPPVLHQRLKEKILSMANNQSLAELLRDPQHHAQTLEVPDPGILQTFNTQDELLKIIKET